MYYGYRAKGKDIEQVGQIQLKSLSSSGYRRVVLPHYYGETMVNPEFQAIKNHPKVAYTTLLIIDFILVFPMVPGARLELAQP